MARPGECCYDPGAELAGDPISPNVCDVNWYAWANVKVVLTTWVDSVEIELAETDTDENGVYLFSDVPPAKNYIITAICPTDKKFVIKDVAEEVVGGETYDAGIAGAESTVLALCLEGLGEVGSGSYLLDLDDFQSHSDYNKVIEEVCDYLANCDYAIPLWVSVLTGLSPELTDDTEDTGGGVFISGAGGGGYVSTSIPTTYTVTFDSQSPTTEAVPTSKTVIAPATTVGTLPTPPTKLGNTFGGWYTETGGGGTVFTASTTVTADIKVYAKWTPITYTVTFDSQSPTTEAVPTSKTVIAPATTVGTLPTPPTKLGNTFGGWYTDTNGGGTEFTASTTVTADITVFADWTQSSCKIFGYITKVTGGNSHLQNGVDIYLDGTFKYKTNGSQPDHGYYELINVPFGEHTIKAILGGNHEGEITIIVDGTSCSNEQNITIKINNN